MPAKIQKKSQTKKSFAKKIISIFVVIFVLSLSWLSYRSMVTPAGINEVLLSTAMLNGNTADSSMQVSVTQTNNIPAGCISWFDGCNTCSVKDGQLAGCTKMACKGSSLPSKCVQFSSEVVDPHIAPSQTTTNQICTMEAGSCVGNDGICVNYVDGCQKSKICSKDQSQATSCRTSKPPAGCTYKQVQCIKAPCEPVLDCGGNSTPSIPPNCTSWFDGCNTCSVVNGQIAGCTKMACKMTANAVPSCLAYAQGTPAPSLIPKESPKSVGMLSSFVATQPCGEAHFKSYRYTCGASSQFVDEGTCISLTTAMSAARSRCMPK